MGGAARLLAIDVDPKSGGDRSILQLAGELGRLPDTLHALTGSGGDHYLFTAPYPWRIPNSAHRVGRGIDVRGENGYIVAPPSLHASGRNYQWANPNAQVLEAPEALLRRLLPPAPLAPSPAPIHHAAPDRVERRARAYLQGLPPAISGSGGHAALWRAAVALVRGFALAPELALVLLREVYNPRCSPPWSERELRHKVKSAASAGLPAGYLLEPR